MRDVSEEPYGLLRVKWRRLAACGCLTEFENELMDRRSFFITGNEVASV